MTGLTDNGRLPYVVAVETDGVWHWRRAFATCAEAVGHLPTGRAAALVGYVRPGLHSVVVTNGVEPLEPYAWSEPVSMGGARVDA